MKEEGERRLKDVKKKKPLYLQREEEEAEAKRQEDMAINALLKQYHLEKVSTE